MTEAEAEYVANLEAQIVTLNERVTWLEAENTGLQDEHQQRGLKMDALGLKINNRDAAIIAKDTEIADLKKPKGNGGQ